MKRGREQSDLVKACAAKHGVTPRAVRKWRDQTDSRWVRFLSERAAAGAVPLGSAALATVEAREWTEEELDLRFQIRKLKEQVADLRERAELAQRAGELDAEMSLRRMWLQHTEALRRLEKDAPAIQKETGEVIPAGPVKRAIFGYVSQVKSRIGLVVDRVLSLHPDLIPEVVQTLQTEIDECLRAAASIDLSNARTE
jgi:hypothetical protein